MKTVIFTILNKEYGLDIQHVQEVIRIRKFVPVPEAADFVEGVMSLRGKVITLINLRKKLGVVKKEIGRSDRIIVTQIERHPLGIIVDTVLGVTNIDPANIIDPDENLKDATYRKGIAKIGPRLIMLMDIESLISNENRKSLGKVAEKIEIRKKA
jgi:purine-binding chemotaxis protein CheW